MFFRHGLSAASLSYDNQSSRIGINTRKGRHTVSPAFQNMNVERLEKAGKKLFQSINTIPDSTYYHFPIPIICKESREGKR